MATLTCEQRGEREGAGIFAEQATRKHIMLVCKGLGICCARLPRQGPRTAGARVERGGGTCSSKGGGARGRIGSEERGAPECCGVSLHVTKFGGVT